MTLFQQRTLSSFRAEEVSPELMTSRRALLRMGCACCVALIAPTYAFAQTPSPEVAQHLAAAKEAAGSDLGAYLVLGRSADPKLQGAGARSGGAHEDPGPTPGEGIRQSLLRR